MRLFVAVMADAATREAALAAQACLRPRLAAARVSWVAPPALHLTVRFLGEVGEDTAAAASEALAPTLATPAFDVRWQALGRFPERGAPRVVWLGCDEGAAAWHALHAEVEARMAGLVPAAGTRFHPHLTLARVKAPGPRSTPWAEALRACVPPPVRTRVTRAVLVHSRLGPAGPSYTALCDTQLA